ncbi:regulatory protein RecX [Flavobacterium orientale]|uniref:Regulatory protein RecX n=1 Tax=Flavobacterium orientale TaxID=1756020 RepID=A0A917D9H6_9FLAO|nr:RecX family transcriptional regulator [Flavobacterium orientale]GGD18478.1 recombinase RecX [Flavobacterium orientale]
MDKNFSYSDCVKKLEYYCSYQERCHQEVTQKLRALPLTTLQQDEIVVHLLQHNFLNEERFAHTFAISKFHQKKWGKIRILNELKQRHLNERLIQSALKTLPVEEYHDTFEQLAERIWETTTERNAVKKFKKCCDYLLRKGWESDLVYAKVKSLSGK